MCTWIGLTYNNNSFSKDNIIIEKKQKEHIKMLYTKKIIENIAKYKWTQSILSLLFLINLLHFHYQINNLNLYYFLIIGYPFPNGITILNFVDNKSLIF